MSCIGPEVDQRILSDSVAQLGLTGTAPSKLALGTMMVDMVWLGTLGPD